MTLTTETTRSKSHARPSSSRVRLPVVVARPARIICATTIAVIIAVFAAPAATAEKSRPASAPEATKAPGPAKPENATAPAPLIIAQGAANLPPPVAEMREAILAAARSGNIDELLIPIQWNELPPNFGDRSVADTIAEWKKASPDGTGRQWLALLINLLEAPHAVIRQGRDVENSKIYIWPAFAELPLTKLSPALDVEFLRLVTASEAQRMKAAGQYDGYGIAIGADGTWHAFTKALKAPKTSK